MKKQKTTKLKRLILRIASVISIISILLCSICISVSADSGSFSVQYPNYSLRLLQLYRGSTVGSIGTQIYNGFKVSYNNNLPYFVWSDTDGFKDIGDLTVRVELQFSRNFNYSQGQDLSVLLPLKLWLYHPVDTVNYSSPAYIDILNLSFINRSSSNTLFDIYYSSTDQSILYDGNIDIQYNATARQDFTFNCISFYFKVNSVPNTYTPKMNVTAFSITDSIQFDFSPVYIMPDFTEQDNANNQEDQILQNGGSLFDNLDTFYSQIGSLGDDFGYLLLSAKAFSLLFDSLFIQGSVLSQILTFSLVLGLSAFIIGVIQTVVSWSSSRVGKYTKGGKS